MGIQESDRNEPGTLRVAILRMPGAGDIPLPAYATAGSAGADLHAAVEEPVEVRRGAITIVPTGIALALPPDCEAQIRPRSGLAARHGVMMVNGPGTIDSDYRGELKVVLTCVLDEPFVIRRGDRVAQLVVASVARCRFEAMATLPGTERGGRGFGHSGLGPLLSGEAPRRSESRRELEWPE